jgi:N-acetylglucosamine-6-sulfatase
MNLTRRELLLGAGAASCSAAPAPRPNFVFILIDDLRYNALGCTGHPFVKTPNIDRIAREGMNFTNTFVTTSLCSPSRGSFLTGRYVHAHGIIDNSNHNEESHKLVTFPKLLRDAGYETGYVGKWHMGNDDSPRPGFDRWVSFRGQGVYADPPLNIDGNRTPTSGYITDLLNGHAVEFISRKRERPFCLYLAHKAVHGPFTPAERHKSLYADQTIARKANSKDTLEGKPALRRGGANVRQGQGGGADELVRNQLRCVASIDEGVGKIFDALTEARQLENTVFVFTSDNGFLWGDHGLGDKRASYEESIRIPMVARYPRLIKPGSKAREMALNIDIGPTFLDLAGVKVPSNMHGRSLAPVMRGAASNWRKSFLMEYFEEKQFPRVPGYQGVRTERWKYTHYTGLEGMDELYDIQADPEEMKNVIGDAASQSALKEMKAELDRILKETNS